MRRSSSSSYLDRPIEREEVTVRQTVVMPKGGYKTARVITKKITLTKIPRSRILENDPDT